MVAGMIYYQEYIGLDALKGSMFALGVLVSLRGFSEVAPADLHADQVHDDTC